MTRKPLLMKRLNHLILTLFLAAATTLVVYWKIPVKGLLPFPGDLLAGRFFPGNTMTWEGYPTGVPYKEFINADVVRQLYPWRDLSMELLKQGELPWWNPYAFSGTPLLANLQSAALYPLNFIYWLASHENAWMTGVISQPILAILWMYLFIRELGLGKEAAFFAGVVFAFSGFMVIWWELNTIGHAALWLPLILWGSEMLIKRRRWVFVVPIVLGQSASLLAGHLQTSLYLTIFHIAYFLFRIATGRNRKGRKKPIVQYATALGVALLVALPQLVPAFRFLPFTPRGSQAERQIFEHFILPPQHLVTIFAHDFFGNPAVGNFWGIDYGEFMAYFGVTALVLLALTIGNPVSKTVYFFIAMLLLSLLFALPTPLPYILERLALPLLSTSAPSRILFVFQFSAAVLAGFGLDLWLKRERRLNLLPLVVVISAYALAWTLVGINTSWKEGVQKANWKVTARNLVLPTGIALGMSSAIVLSTRATPRLTNAKKDIRFTTSERPTLLLPQALLKWGKVSLVFGLALVEYSYFANKFQTFSERRFVFPENSVFSYLRQEMEKEPARFFGDYTASVTSNSWIPYRVYGVEGYDSLYIGRYGQLLAAADTGKIPATSPRSDANLIPNRDDIRRRRLQDLLGVRYILDKNDNPKSDWEPDPHRFTPDRYQLRWQQGKFKVYENTASLPRAFLVGNLIVETDHQKIVDRLFDPTFELTQTAILEEKPNEEITPSAGEVTFISYRPNRVELKVTTTTQQLLFLSDPYYPDWQVTVDHENKKIYRANFAFRAVLIPEGLHTVLFKYKPRLF